MPMEVPGSEFQKLLSPISKIPASVTERNDADDLPGGIEHIPVIVRSPALGS